CTAASRQQPKLDLRPGIRIVDSVRTGSDLVPRDRESRSPCPNRRNRRARRRARQALDRAGRLAVRIERLKVQFARARELIRPCEPDALSVPCDIRADRFARRIRDSAGAPLDVRIELVDRADEQIDFAVTVTLVE